MSVDIESARPGSVPRGEATARVELYELGRRLAGSHDAEIPLAKLLDDVAATWHRVNADMEASR